MARSSADKLYGGYSQSGLVTGNSLTINGGYTGQNSFGVTFTLRGAASVTGDVVGNSLTIKKMLIGSSGLTVGHESLSGRVAENDVVLESVIINKTPTYVGSYAGSGPAERNTLTVRGTKSPYGGEGSELPTRIDRAYAVKAGNLARDNVATLEDWSYVGEFGAALVGSGLAEGNEVHLKGKHVRVQLVYGVQASTDAEANRNSVFLESGPRTDDADALYFLPYGSLTGAQTENGNAAENQVVVTGGAVAGDIYGARSLKGNVRSNLVRIADAGGVHSGLFVGGYSAEGTASENRVLIEEGTLNGTLAGGQTSSGTASGNIVEMKGGKIDGTVYARYVSNGLANGSTDHSKSVGNRIVLKGGKSGQPDLSETRFAATNVSFELAPPPGDCTSEGTCHDGVIEVPDDEPIPGDPPAGAAGAVAAMPAVAALPAEAMPRVASPRAVSAAETGSTLEIDGFSGSVLSVSDFERIDFTNVLYTDGSADRPILTILDSENSNTADTWVSVSRITLEGGTDLANLKTLKLIEVANAPETTFKYDESKVFDIYQGAGVVAQGSLVASVTDGVGVGAPNVPPEPDPNPDDGDQDGMGDNGSTDNPGTGGGDDSGNSGGGNTDSGGSDGGNDGAGDNGSTDNPGTGDGGCSGNENPDSGNGDEEPNNPETPEQPEEPDNPGTDDGSGDNSGGSGGIDVDVDNVRMNPQMRLVARTRAASVAFANTGAELVSEKLSALRAETREGGHFFGGIYGKREKFQVASDLDIKGYSAIVGAGWRSRASFADVTGALFYEHGKGDYTTENTFAGQSFDGTGSLRTNGGGAALRFDFENGTHASASIRIGDLNTSMDNVLMDGMDRVWVKTSRARTTVSRPKSGTNGRSRTRCVSKVMPPTVTPTLSRPTSRSERKSSNSTPFRAIA